MQNVDSLPHLFQGALMRLLTREETREFNGIFHPQCFGKGRAFPGIVEDILELQEQIGGGKLKGFPPISPGQITFKDFIQPRE